MSAASLLLTDLEKPLHGRRISRGYVLSSRRYPHVPVSAEPTRTIDTLWNVAATNCNTAPGCLNQMVEPHRSWIIKGWGQKQRLRKIQPWAFISLTSSATHRVDTTAHPDALEEPRSNDGSRSHPARALPHSDSLHRPKLQQHESRLLSMLTRLAWEDSSQLWTIQIPALPALLPLPPEHALGDEKEMKKEEPAGILLPHWDITGKFSFFSMSLLSYYGSGQTKRKIIVE